MTVEDGMMRVSLFMDLDFLVQLDLNRFEQHMSQINQYWLAQRRFYQRTSNRIALRCNQRV